MEVLRIVLLGKRGAGKSSAGNTLLGTKPFHTAPSSQGVTQTCSMSTSTVDGHKICVVDTPGWTDLGLTEAETIKEIAKCIDFSDPGPHVILLVLPIGRFTKEEIDTAKQILEVFGEEANKYTMVLFTKGDDLEEKTIEEYLKGVHPDLKKVIEVCGGRYHVFNNRDKENRKQVSTLLKKIKGMVQRNKGRYYSRAMFQKMEEEMEEKRKMQKFVQRALEDTFKVQESDSAVKSNNGAVSRPNLEEKHCPNREERNSQRKKEEDYKACLQKGSDMLVLNQNRMLGYNGEQKHKMYPSTSHSEDPQSRSSKSGNYSRNMFEMEWQNKEAELQSFTENMKTTWLKEKSGLEKEMYRLRQKQEAELEKVKKELQLQQDTVQALRCEVQQQRKELERLRRENDEGREKMKRRNSALQQNFDEMEREIVMNKDSDLKTSFQKFASQLKKHFTPPK